MKVLVIGGTGVISRAVTTELLRKGHEVVVLNRGTRRLSFAKDVRHIVCDRADRAQFQRCLQDIDVDVAIDMICYDADDARATVDALRGRVQQLIVCSSSLAYRRPYRSLPIREDQELLNDDQGFPRAFQKAQMERYLRGIALSDMAITVIRPSLTFGPGTAGFGILRQNYGVVQRIREGKPLLMFGDGTNPWSFTFTADLAKAFVGAVGNSATYGQQYHATSEERTVWQDVYLELGKILEREVQLFYLPAEVLYRAAPQLCAHLYYEKRHIGAFDNSKIRRDIPEFMPQMSLNQGLRELIAWYESESDYVDPVKDALEDKLHAAYQRLVAEVENIYAE